MCDSELSDEIFGSDDDRVFDVPVGDSGVLGELSSFCELGGLESSAKDSLLTWVSSGGGGAFLAGFGVVCVTTSKI